MSLPHISGQLKLAIYEGYNRLCLLKRILQSHKQNAVPDTCIALEKKQSAFCVMMQANLYSCCHIEAATQSC